MVNDKRTGNSKDGQKLKVSSGNQTDTEQDQILFRSVTKGVEFLIKDHTFKHRMATTG